MSIYRLINPIHTLKMAFLLSAAGVMTTGLSGCASVGQDFAASRVMEIKIGETTQQQIREIFGPPWRVGIEDGKNTWTYGKYKYSVFGPDDTQDLIIRFDNRGVVRSYTFNTSRK